MRHVLFIGREVNVFVKGIAVHSAENRIDRYPRVGRHKDRVVRSVDIHAVEQVGVILGFDEADGTCFERVQVDVAEAVTGFRFGGLGCFVRLGQFFGLDRLGDFGRFVRLD